MNVVQSLTLAALVIGLPAALVIGTRADAAPVRSNPDLGKAEGQCRPGEQGPAFLVEADGLKDRRGRLKLEVYPGNDADFLADDNVLINQGKTFRRVEVAIPPTGLPRVCIRIPGPGFYALTLLHDRDSDRHFGLSVDGVGFSRNPKLGLAKPKAAVVRIEAGAGLTTVHMVMNYRKGLLSFGPLATH